MTNIIIGQEIFNLQSHGGISTVWRNLKSLLPALLPDCTFDPALPADVFLSTYYQPAPEGTKSVVMVFDFIAERYPGIPRFTPDSQWKHAAIDRADAVIAISQWTAGDVKKFTGRDATVAYPATTLERADFNEPFGKAWFRDNVRPGYILMVGRRGLYKNAASLYQALKMLPNHPPVVVTTEEALTPDEIALMKRGLWHQAVIEPEDLAKAYTRAACLVYPSLYEGFGLPVLEAYACGCPVICGNGGALAEINEAALVVDVTRPREIAEALVKMADPGVRIDHILRGYEVAKRFSWQAMAERVAVVIRSVVEKETVA